MRSGQPDDGRGENRKPDALRITDARQARSRTLWFSSRRLSVGRSVGRQQYKVRSLLDNFATRSHPYGSSV
jgi:hypothetical protein